MKFTHYIYLSMVAGVTALLSLSGAALAADTVDPADGSLDLATTLYKAFTGGHRAYAAALALVAVVALVRKKWGSSSPWLHTDAGSAGMVLLGTFGTTLAASLAGGGALTGAMAWSATCVAFATAGGYSMLKHLIITPVFVPLAARAPAPFKQLLQALIWFFVHASDMKSSANQAKGNAPTAPSVP